MTRAKNLVLVTVVSPELLLVLVLIAFISFVPETLGELGDKLRADPEVWKYLPSLTLLFAGAVFAYSSKIRAPVECGGAKPLYEWPLYQLLVDRVNVSLVFASASFAASLILWVFGKSWSSATVGVVFLGANGVAGTTAVTMLLAHQKLRELLVRFGG